MFTLSVKTKHGTQNISLNAPRLLSEVLEEYGFFVSHPCGKSGICKKCKVRAEGNFQPECENGYVLSCCTNIVGDGVVYINESEKTDCNTNEECNTSIDIGTTSVVCRIQRASDGKLINVQTIPNSQGAYGSDVLTRMDFSVKGGGEKLKSRIIEDLKKLTKDFNIKKSVIVGNTAMLHMLLGYDVAEMSVYPFTPTSLFGEYRGNCYIPKCVSAFIGCDVTAAVLYTQMTKHKYALLLDIGTNSEIILWNGNEFLCCSASAGPAFEGVGISQGMIAKSGAINHTEPNGTYSVMGDCSPVGICGSGLIDVLSVMKSLYVIDKSGYMEEDFEIGNSGVFITPKDVRALQTAKSAIRSGIEILLNISGITAEKLDMLYISGAFGSYINPENAMDIGMIPKIFSDKIKAVGNGAVFGAEIMLGNEKYMAEHDKIVGLCKTISLTEHPDFERLYMENMSF